MELRCQYKLHGHVDGDVIEVSCQSALCGKRAGVVVLHRFSLTTGELISTRRFKDPVKPTSKGGANGSGHCVSIRHS